MVQIITLNKGNVIKKGDIERIINSARSTWHYARFNLPKNIYVTIIYNRDNTIEIATNSTNLAFYQQMQSIRRAWTQARVTDFLFVWLNKFLKG